MKQLSLLSTFIFFISFSSFAQFKISEGSNYSSPIQLDSSDSYIIGYLINKSNKSKYNTGINDAYSYAFQNSWTNISIYNSKSSQNKKLFSDNLNLVYPVNSGIYIANTYEYGAAKMAMYSVVLKNHLVLAVKSDEYNKDGFIDEEDPIYLFICAKDGNGLTQISPKEMNVTSYKISRDGKTLFINGQKDKNGDKKFVNEDEMIFQLNIDTDISKIKTSQVNL